MIKENLMNNSINVIHSLISNFTPPSSITADIEILCQGFEKMFAGHPSEMTVFSQRLARVLEWAKVRPSVEDPSTKTGWRAQYAGLPMLGGTLTCQNDAWELMLSFDATHTAYMGSWRSLRPGEEDHGGLFSIENTSSGQVLVLDTGQTEQQVQLTGSQRIAWGSIAAFRQSIQIEDSLQTDNQAGTSTPAALPSKHPAVDFSSNDAPTILAKPTKQKNPAVKSPSETPEAEISTDSAPTILAKSTKQKNASVILSTEITDKKPVPTEQPTKTQPDVWQCTCGNTNVGPVCLKCGKEKPSTSTVKESEAAQPTVCKVCGTEISIGAKFCRHCGSEVQK
jgi:ribosomal protein L40E